MKGFINWCNKAIARRAAAHGYLQCHRTALQIAWLGQDNSPEIQRELDQAKDCLYAAAIEYDKLK